MIIIPTLRQIARALRCGEHHSETVLHDKAAGERSLALSRRGLFRAGGAIAAGALISVPVGSPGARDIATWPKEMVVELSGGIREEYTARLSLDGKRSWSPISYATGWALVQNHPRVRAAVRAARGFE